MRDLVMANHMKFMRRWGAYLSNRLEHDVPFPQVQRPPDLEPPAPAAAKRKRVVLRSQTTIGMSDDSCALLRQAAHLGESYRVVIAAPEVCSRLRIRSICQQLDIKPANFELERISDLNQRA